VFFKTSSTAFLTIPQSPAIKNAPLPADGPGATSFSNTVLIGLIVGVPTYLAWKVGGGWKTSIFFALFTTVPILMGVWYTFSNLSPRKNEKVRLPGLPIEHYLTFKNEADRATYSGRNKIPMETFMEKYFDDQVSFNGDALEVLEYRHDWCKYSFTMSLFKFFLFQFIPEVIMHTRSQGELPRTCYVSCTKVLKMRNRFATIMTAVTTSTDGSWDHA